MRKFRSLFSPRRLADSSDRLSEWFATPLGQCLLAQEQQAIADELKYLFGYHFMQLGLVKGLGFASHSRINHCFSLSPTCHMMASPSVSYSAVAEFDRLPLQDETIDVSVLHHVLEFSQNPHQVLKEAARVTVPRGNLIIVAFNPLSINGLFQPLGALVNNKSIYRRRALRAGRMRDWLAFLDFTCVNTRDVFHNLPVNSVRYLASTRFIESVFRKSRLPMGMSYVMVARKDKMGFTPIKPTWERSALLGAMPIGKQAIRLNAARHNLGSVDAKLSARVSAFKPRKQQRR